MKQNRVDVYSTKKSTLMCHSGQRSVHIFHQDMYPIYDTDLLLFKNQIEQEKIDIDNAEIRQFNFCNGAGTNTIFAAFDRELLRLIGCLESQRDAEVHFRVQSATKPLKEEIQIYKDILIEHSQLSLWKRIKLVFKDTL